MDERGDYLVDRRIAWTVNPSCPRTLTAPLFPPSKSPEARRSPVASSEAVPRIAFGGERRLRPPGSYRVLRRKPWLAGNRRGPSGASPRVARHPVARGTVVPALR